jgi:hypothetical protein
MTLIIDSVSGENFAGTKTIEFNDRSQARVVTSISGYVNKDQLYLRKVALLYKKDPPDGKTVDCSSCTPQIKITIKQDSVVIAVLISDCQEGCNRLTFYRRYLCDYDSTTQRYLINLFGTSSDIANFKPCTRKPPEIIASDPDKVKPNEDSLRNAAALAKKRQKEIDDSTKNAIALAKKRQQQIDDSIALVKKRQQQVADSLVAVAAIARQKEQKRQLDSLANAAALALKRQREIDDSTKNAIAFAKKRQQQIDDSIALVRKRQKQLDDSLIAVATIARQKEQQRIQDSLTNAAALAKKRQKEIDDSTANAIALAKKHQQQTDDSVAFVKKRQKQVNDSLIAVAAIARQKEQQRIQDSLTNAAALAKKRQKEIDDSTANAIALAKTRQQQIDDSIALVKKRQKQVNDSLAAVAVIAKQKEQKRIMDSLANAAAFALKRQKEIDDSTKNAIALAKRRQQQIDDSTALAKKRQQQVNDSINIAKQREQLRIRDSVNSATAKANKQPVSGKDSGSASTTKAFETRDNVLLQSYHITTPDILVELFDNAEIDGDRVSVYHNNDLIVHNQMLLREPITFKVHADATNRTHEFILIAENLGTIPPNTALMRITVGTQVYKLSVKTDLKTNARIMFYYDGN